MRKIQKEIKKFSEIENILLNNVVCRIAFAKDNQPYCVPMNYGYKERVIYCHSGFEGLKMDFIRANPYVCVEVDQNIHVISQDSACKYSCAYESVIAFGKVLVIDNVLEKKAALDIIMNQITKNSTGDYDSDILKKTAILKIALTEISGKRSPK